MKKNKKFDCVKMKWDIQQKIDNEYLNVPDKKAHEIQLEKAKENSILGPFLKKIYSKNVKRSVFPKVKA